MEEKQVSLVRSVGGRPTKRTPEMVRLICEGIARGVPIVNVCSIAGISQQTFSTWRDTDPDFREKIERARAEGIDRRLKIIEDAAVSEWRAAAWLLEHTAPEHFAKTRIQHEHVAHVTHEFTISPELMNQLVDARKNYDRRREIPADT